MSSRQKIYVGLAVSASVCTGIVLFLYLRHRRKLALSKTPNSKTSASIFSHRGSQYTDITSSSSDNVSGNSESVKFRSDENQGATVEVDIPGGCIPLTTDQAIVLMRFLDESKNDIERLHRILTNIANSATINESQINLTNAGCINHLRDILLTTNNDTTKCKILLALNNLALNDYTITHFNGIVSIVINLCRTTSLNSSVRLYGLNLLINMSVLEYLHDEYMKDINEFDLLIKSTFENQDEMLSIGKVLVNLSTNKLNIENLLKITSIELQTIVKLCTPNKKLINNDVLSKLEDILLRYVTFYCNLAEMIVNELQHKSQSTYNIKSWLIDPLPYRQSAVYFELFDHDKQMSSKSILRPQYASNIINKQIKRLRHAMDTIRQIQFESSVLSVNDEFNDDDHITTVTDFSTPKKFPESPIIIDDNNLENSFDVLTKDVNEQFEDDNTILPDPCSPSDQSLPSFRSANSTNENNTFTSLDESIST
ncbi:unnamed protein product [Rotaria sordida]|uniref:Armadillo repeat-containing domain-containing protein n=1 Tax=Rotaria sordida TaxID=392033 RepID=A0A814HY99_9BILA|nr:unnamed protein product [Rotaria sordida]